MMSLRAFLFVLLAFSFINLAEQNVYAKISSRGAEERIAEYFDLLKRGNFSASYKMLSSEDRKAMALKTYTREMTRLYGMIEKSKKESAVLYSFLRKNGLTYKIKSSSMRNGKFYSTLVISLPDLFPIAFDLTKAEPKLKERNLSQGLKDRLYRSAIKKTYSVANVPRTEYVRKVVVGEERGKGYIFVNLQKIVNIKESRKLAQMAWNAKWKGNHEEAVKLYERAVKLDPENEQFKISLADARKSLEKKRIKEKEIAEYRSLYLKVTDAKIIDIDGRKFVICTFINNGKRKVEVKTIRVTCKNSGGVTVFDGKVKLNQGTIIMVEPGSRFVMDEPVEIKLTKQYDSKSTKVTIEDFYFSRW